MRSLLKSYIRGEQGSASIETCLWVPTLIFFFALTFDATYVFLRDGEIRRIVGEGNRQYVLGHHGANTSTLETWLEDKLSRFAPTVDANAFVDGTGRLHTSVTYQVKDTQITGIFSSFLNLTVEVNAVNQTEI